MNGRRRFAAIVVLMIFLLATSAAALELLTGSADGGGGTSSGGTLSLTGTAGQPDAQTSAGADLTLEGGIWWGGAGVATTVPDPSALPASFRLHPAAPNPFNPMTTLRFDVPQTSRVRIDVLDLRGRVVAKLEDAVLSPGSHSVSWRGRDDHSIGVASGTYFVRMRAHGFGATTKITLVK